MIAAIVQHYFSDDYLIQDYLLYVRPADRGSSAASRMLKAFSQWTNEQKDIKMIICGISTEIETEKTARLYELFGFRLAGVLMRRDI